MLRSSRVLKQQWNSLSSTFNRTYHYQTEIYNNDFIESKRVNNQFYENLRKDTEDLYSKAKEEPNLYRFIKAYRQYGFKIGEVNPLRLEKISKLPLELDPAQYGLDSAAKYSTNGLLFGNNNENELISLSDIENYLRDVYSKNLTIEFDHISNEEEKLWIAREFENMASEKLDNQTKVEVLKLLLKSQVI